MAKRKKPKKPAVKQAKEDKLGLRVATPPKGGPHKDGSKYSRKQKHPSKEEAGE